MGRRVTGALPAGRGASRAGTPDTSQMAAAAAAAPPPPSPPPPPPTAAAKQQQHVAGCPANLAVPSREYPQDQRDQPHPDSALHGPSTSIKDIPILLISAGTLSASLLKQPVD